MKTITLSILSFCFASFVCAQENRVYYEKVLDTTTDKELKLLALDSLSDNLNFPDINAVANYNEACIDLALELKQYDLAIEKSIRVSYIINNRLGQPKRALALRNNIEKYLDKTDDSYLIGGHYLKKAGIYVNLKEYDKAISFFTKSIENYSENDSMYKADAIYFRGQANQLLGNYLYAINDYTLASSYYENVGDMDYMFYTQSSAISVYNINGFDEKGLEERSKLIAKKLKLKSYSTLPNDYSNQATTYEKLGDTKKQEFNLLEALKYLKYSHLETTTSSENNIIHINSELAKLYAKQGDLEKARRYLKVAETESDKLTSGLFKEHFKKNKAYYLFYSKNYDASLKLAESIYSKLTNKNDPHFAISLQNLLYKLYKKKGNSKKALDFFALKTKIKDSLFNTKKTNALTYYQTLYETEKKEKEIDLQKASISNLELKNKSKLRLIGFITIGSLISIWSLSLFFNKKRLKKEQQLQENYSQKILVSQELERKRISKDLHDGLGQSLLLIKNKVALNNDENTKNLLNNAIDEMRSISNMLHPFQLEEIGISKALENLIQQIDENTETYVFGDIEPIEGKLNSQQEVNVFRIVQECLSNIIKHAKADSAKVNLVLHEEYISVTIKDNGVGFDFSQKYNDFKSLGLKTIKERVKFLNGTIKIQSTKNEGSIFDITFPIT